MHMKEHDLPVDLIQESTWTHSRIRDTDTVNSMVSQTYRHQV